MQVINDRLIELVNTLEKGSQAEFARRIGVRSGVVGDMFGKRKNKPSFEVLSKIAQAYPQLQLDWLVLGQGAMLRASGSVSAVPETRNIEPLPESAKAPVGTLLVVWYVCEDPAHPRIELRLEKTVEIPVSLPVGQVIVDGGYGFNSQLPQLRVEDAYYALNSRQFVLELEVIVEERLIDFLREKEIFLQAGWKVAAG